MTLNARKIGILNMLVRSDSCVSPGRVMSDWKIEKSTVYRDIKEINDWLEGQKLQPVHRARKNGFYLNVDEKDVISEKHGRLNLESDYLHTPRSDKPGLEFYC